MLGVLLGRVWSGVWIGCEVSLGSVAWGILLTCWSLWDLTILALLIDWLREGGRSGRVGTAVVWIETSLALEVEKESIARITSSRHLTIRFSVHGGLLASTSEAHKKWISTTRGAYSERAVGVVIVLVVDVPKYSLGSHG